MTGFINKQSGGNKEDLQPYPYATVEWAATLGSFYFALFKMQTSINEILFKKPVVYSEQHSLGMQTIPANDIKMQ